MVFRIGQANVFPIANVNDPTPNKATEAELKKFDTNSDGVLDMNEAATFHAAKKGGFAPQTMGDAVAVAGGAQHEVKTLRQYAWDIGGATNWRGDFNIPGVGAGNVRADRNSWNSANADVLNVLVDCNLMDKAFLENQVSQASLVIGPKGFNPETGSSLGEAVAVPMNMVTEPGYQSFSRGGGSSYVPEKKFLGAAVDVGDLRSLAGNAGGVSMYMRLDLQDGRTLYVNKDGMPGRNFDIDASELKAKGTP